MENLERIRERLHRLLAAPLLPVTIAYMAGVVWHAHFHEWWWAVIVISISGIITFFIDGIPTISRGGIPTIFRGILTLMGANPPSKSKAWRAGVYPLLLGIAAAAGMSISTVRTPVSPAYLTDGHVRVLSGRVTDHTEYQTGQMMVVRVDSCQGRKVSPYLVKTYIPRVYPPCYETYRVKFSGRFTPLKDITDLPEQTDHNISLKRRGISAEAVVSPDSIRYVRPEGGLINSARRNVMAVQRLIGSAPIGDPCKNFLLATLTGDREWIEADTLQLFSTTGLAHVLALSGMHVAIITFLLTVVLMPLNMMRRGRYAAIITSILVLWLFAIMTGLSVSVVRAVTMATMFGICTLMQRVWNPMNALAAAALGITIIWPQEVFSPGFILTFTAVACILVITPALSVRDERAGWKRTMWQWIAVPIAAMAGTGIVSLYYFHTLPLCFLLTNVVSSLLLPGIIGGGIVLILLNSAGFTCVWLGKCVDVLYTGLEKWAGWTEGLPMSHIDNLYMPGWMIGVYFALLATITAWLYTRRRVWLLTAGIIMAAAPVWYALLKPVYPKVEIFMTRSNACTNIYFKDGEKLLWYTNAPEEEQAAIKSRAEKLYRPYMLSRGLKEIKLLNSTAGTARQNGRPDIIDAHGYRFVVANTDVSDSLTERADYAVLCRGVNHPVETARGIGADTVLLSEDIHGTRLKRYEQELIKAGIPVIAVHERPFRIRR